MPASEQLPEALEVEFLDDGLTVSLVIDGRPAGAPLTDARRIRDGYRFHDVMHLAFAALLGWSPVIRGMLGRKRRSDPQTDECEDGGRACMVEEALCHLIHVHHRDFQASDEDRLTDLVRRMVIGFEVERCTAEQWTEAIRVGLSLRNALTRMGGGRVSVDLVRGTLNLIKGRQPTPA
jgi:hypothetical protein